MLYTADFETTTDTSDCRVWAWGVCNIYDIEVVKIETELEDFIRFMEKSFNSTFYFHNLKFDGEFIIAWLLNNGFRHVIDKKEVEDKTFTTLISDKGQFYCMEIIFRKWGKKVRKALLLDSLKILPFSVADIAKGWGMEIQKEVIDYTKPRPKGYKPTPEEISYLQKDIQIPAKAIKTLLDENLKKMTNGSNALFDYKNTVTTDRFDKWFPIPDYEKDYFIRQSYKGGFTYCSPRYQGKDLGRGFTLDVNSLYPSVMRYKPLPFGDGVFFEGKYEADEVYPLYTQNIKCQFRVKKGMIPTIQLKNNLAFVPTEFLESSGDEEIALCLTNIDLELFFEHYDVFNLEYVSGYKFKATDTLFAEYIDKWVSEKINAEKQGNKAKRQLAKLMLNALYGKFALNPNVQSKIPYLTEDGAVSYKLGDPEIRKPIYIPVGTFVTSWARHITITSAQKIRSAFDRGESDIDFCYADTDSLHCVSTSGALPVNILEIDKYKLGAWKHESNFIQARFIRQKTYIEKVEIEEKDIEKMSDEQKTRVELIDGKYYNLVITCAGMPKDCYKFVTWENFEVGSAYKGKKKPKHVKGGVVLVDEDFTIKKMKPRVDKERKK